MPHCDDHDDDDKKSPGPFSAVAQNLFKSRTVLLFGEVDVADDYIVAHAERGDITITSDIPLAARLVERGVVVLSSSGEAFDDENIRERLSVRDFMSDLRDAGVMTGGPSAYGEKEKRRFAGALDRALARARSG